MRTTSTSARPHRILSARWLGAWILTAERHSTRRRSSSAACMKAYAPISCKPTQASTTTTITAMGFRENLETARWYIAAPVRVTKHASGVAAPDRLTNASITSCEVILVLRRQPTTRRGNARCIMKGINPLLRARVLVTCLLSSDHFHLKTCSRLRLAPRPEELWLIPREHYVRRTRGDRQSLIAPSFRQLAGRNAVACKPDDHPKLRHRRAIARLHRHAL
jgi:hypothetical protein